MLWFGFRLLVLPKKLPSPGYRAVIVCVPCESEEVLRLAMPLVKVAGKPSGALSARNCTVPVGVPLPGETAVKVAVKVTFEPVGDGLAEDETALVVLAGVIVSWPLTKLKL